MTMCRACAQVVLDLLDSTPGSMERRVTEVARIAHKAGAYGWTLPRPQEPVDAEPEPREPVYSSGEPKSLGSFNNPVVGDPSVGDGDRNALDQTDDA